MSTPLPSSTALRPLDIDIVSVQSQVVYGSVGNSIALPAFTQQGLRVAAVPTVILSNTPHYASLHGGALPVEWFAGYLDDLSARGALQQLRAIQAGYLGSAEQAGVLARWIKEQLAKRPDVRAHVDPVIGDHDHGVYIDPAIVSVYREHLLPLANGLFPNGFELGHLTGHRVDTIDQVVAAARTLLGRRTEWVIVTSAAPTTWNAGQMRVAVVTATTVDVIDHARVDAAPKGTGDLFSAVVTSRLLAGRSILEAARQGCNTVVAAVTLTHDRHCAELLLPD